MPDPSQPHDRHVDDAAPPAPPLNLRGRFDWVICPGEGWSWSDRMAAALGCTRRQLMSDLVPGASPRRLDCLVYGVGITDEEYAVIAERLGVPPMRVRDSALDALTGGPCRFVTCGTGSAAMVADTELVASATRHSICAGCLSDAAASGTPGVVELINHLGTWGLCPQHLCEVAWGCAGCGAPITVDPDSIPTPGRCRHCGFDFADTPTMWFCDGDPVVQAATSYGGAVAAHIGECWWGSTFRAADWFAAVHQMIKLAAWLYEHGDISTRSGWLLAEWDAHQAARGDMPADSPEAWDAILGNQAVDAACLWDAVRIADASPQWWRRRMALLAERCRDRLAEHPEQAATEDYLIGGLPAPMQAAWRHQRYLPVPGDGDVNVDLAPEHDEEGE